MKLDENPQMVVMLDHAKGSLENKIRQAYNSGYNDGFKAGVFEAWDDMREQLNKSLRQQYDRKTVPKKWETPPKFEHKGSITTCVGVPMALIETEPQTERSE